MGPTLVSPGVIQYAPSPPPAYGTGTQIQRGAISSGVDFQDGGNYKLTGTVKITPASPTFARVRLHDFFSGRIVRETWSDPATGAYAFTRIRNGQFYVVSFDHTGTYNAVIADRLVPELMP